jgi:hypothetical protein
VGAGKDQVDDTRLRMFRVELRDPPLVGGLLRRLPLAMEGEDGEEAGGE